MLSVAKLEFLTNFCLFTVSVFNIQLYNKSTNNAQNEYKQQQLVVYIFDSPYRLVKIRHNS